MEDQRVVRLRLHHGGSFHKVIDNAGWRYRGGSVYNDTIPLHTRYHELVKRLNDKLGESVQIKYLTPGEGLDPDALVNLSDDDDLQELYREYLESLQEPGQTVRTLRVHVFLVAALQFEIERTEVDDEAELMDEEPGLEEDEDAHASRDLACKDSINYDSYCSNVYSSCGDPSSDTAWQMAHMQCAYQHMGYDPTDYHHHHHMDPHMAGPGALDAELLQEELLGAGGYEAPELDPDQQLEHTPNKQGQSLYSRPLERVRDLVQGLPSHISVFGQGYSKGSDAVGPPPVGSLRLPSHISEFGDRLQSGLQQQGGSTGGGLEHNDGLVRGWDTSRFNTQILVSTGSHHASDGDGSDAGRGGSAGDAGEAGGQAGGAGGGGGGGGGTPGDSSQAPSKTFQLDNVKSVCRSEVHDITKIGEGAFGEVTRAQVFPYGTVAIKWLKRDRFAKYIDSFQREAEVLAKLNHPHIIRMFGMVTSEPPASSTPSSAAGSCAGGSAPPSSSPSSGGTHMAVEGIMMEFIHGGSLAQRCRSLSSAGRHLSLQERCRIALQAAMGMTYLHDQQPAVIHFDLKPDNLLLEGEGDTLKVKVADFGLSKHKIQNYVTCHDLRGTLPYMAPELVKCPTQVCERCDVWSMGVVMWEMLTLEIPFQELTAQDILRGLLQGTLSLRIPSSCEPEWRELILSCMQAEPIKRPTFRQLAHRLEEIGRQLAAQQRHSVGSGAGGHLSGHSLGHQQQQQQQVQQAVQQAVGLQQQHDRLQAQANQVAMHQDALFQAQNVAAAQMQLPQVVQYQPQIAGLAGPSPYGQLGGGHHLPQGPTTPAPHGFMFQPYMPAMPAPQGMPQLYGSPPCAVAAVELLGLYTANHPAQVQGHGAVFPGLHPVAPNPMMYH